MDLEALMRILASSEATEPAKLTETTYLGLMGAWAHTGIIKIQTDVYQSR